MHSTLTMMQELAMQELEENRKNRLLIAVTYSAVGVAVTLMILKLGVWWVSGAVSLLASFVDSLMDGIVSLLNLWAVKIAMQPADDEHQFGHAKAEPLAGLAQAVFIAASALFLCIYSIDRLINYQPLEQTELAISLMFVSILLTGALVTFQYHVVRQTGSIAIKADATHYTSDIYANLGVIIALALSYFGFGIADPIVGLLIGLYILYTAMQLGKEAVDFLMDKALPEEDEQTIKDIVLEQQGVVGLHDLKTRDSGKTKFIQLHVELPGAQSLTAAHHTSQHIEDTLKAQFPNADIVIHKDPID